MGHPVNKQEMNWTEWRNELLKKSPKCSRKKNIDSKAFIRCGENIILHDL